MPSSQPIGHKSGQVEGGEKVQQTHSKPLASRFPPFFIFFFVCLAILQTEVRIDDAHGASFVTLWDGVEAKRWSDIRVKTTGKKSVDIQAEKHRSRYKLLFFPKFLVAVAAVQF